ncbi:murein transglycosylase A [Siccirubricoccus phaeus]|uniref:murein transglycosylase A n=1 Tax=Siccirubricoccus phaeus TaxID=2595053 RepID=UPI001F3F703A|nr:MltA domain-containing protein [Siccirubricoccus phaeus]
MAALALLLALAAAGRAQEGPRAVGFAALPGWPGESPLAALPPWLATCRALAGWAAERPLGGAGRLGELGGAAALSAEACREAGAFAATPPPASAGPRRRRLTAAAAQRAARAAALRRLIERHYQPFAMGRGLLTGYYEPELRGAEYPTGEYQVPLLGLPAPRPALPDRGAIEEGALAGERLEIVFVDDPVDAFFLQIQGSGRVKLHDGQVLRLGYAGQNGHPYRSVGRFLIERGEVPKEQMSMQAIRAWLASASPGAAGALLRQNPAYVFFRRVEGLRPEEGPLGALGVPLTPGRSLAVDPAFIPFGALVYVVTKDPVDGRPIRRLVHAQDTGGAIRGPARGDLFWGWGKPAMERAGLMKEEAEVFVLVPRAKAALQAATRAAGAAASPPAAAGSAGHRRSGPR